MRRIALLIAVVATTACGPGNSLDGSIGESFDLDFERVRIRIQDRVLIVEYLKTVAGARNKVCKVTVDGQNFALAGGAKLQDDVFLERVTVQRIANTGGDFPEVEEGEFELGTFEPQNGGDAHGRFKALFVGGRTLQGSFDGTVEVVPLD